MNRKILPAMFASTFLLTGCETVPINYQKISSGVCVGVGGFFSKSRERISSSILGRDASAFVCSGAGSKMDESDHERTIRVAEIGIGKVLGVYYFEVWKNPKTGQTYRAVTTPLSEYKNKGMNCRTGTHSISTVVNGKPESFEQKLDVCKGADGSWRLSEG